MTELWRCDCCYELIDPAEGDERTQLGITLDVDGEESETEVLDLCEDCRPSSVGGHVDWMLHAMEDL